MALLLADVETVIVKRVGAFMVRAKMSVVGTPNPALADPILWALRMLGYTPASIAAATDGDLASVVATHTDALLDLAELRTLESVLTNIPDVSTTAGPVSQSWGQLRTDLLTLIPRKRANVAAMHEAILQVALDADAPAPVRLRSV